MYWVCVFNPRAAKFQTLQPLAAEAYELVVGGTPSAPPASAERSAPMLTGKRVLLRPMREADIATQHIFDQDLELYGLDSATPQVSALARTQAFYATRTTFDATIAPFAIEADTNYIGHCALRDIHNRNGNLELGITIGDRAYWGRGYGREVIALLLYYGFHYLGARRIGLTTHAKNERAIRCYLACGFVEEGRPRQIVWIEGAYTDLVEMSILRDEWQAQVDSAAL